MKTSGCHSRGCSDPRTLIPVVTVFAALAIPVRLSAQDQPQPKEQRPPDTAATARYNFLIGSGLLCASDDSTACPAVARAANEETIEISGAGALDLAANSVTAAGAFVEKTPAGDIVSTGVWTATGLVSFQSYGVAAAVLMPDYPKLGTPEPLPMGKMPGPLAAMMAGPLAAGGAAVIGIRLLPDVGSPRDAVLQVNCAKAKRHRTGHAMGSRWLSREVARGSTKRSVGAPSSCCGGLDPTLLGRALRLLARSAEGARLRFALKPADPKRGFAPGRGSGERIQPWTVPSRLANETRLQIAVAHFPPVTSKWNKIEHRLPPVHQSEVVGGLFSPANHHL
jgi:hypothetical protein